jgi:hypothetical protein
MGNEMIEKRALVSVTAYDKMRKQTGVRRWMDRNRGTMRCKKNFLLKRQR